MRELTDELDQFIIDDSDEEPILCWRDGTEVDTWKEGYPYDTRMKRDEYELEKRRLQIELLKLQNWSKDVGARVLLLFEGRDAVGKGGTIKRFMEHLNPRGARAWWRWRSPIGANRRSGTSSAISSTCPPRARS